MIFVFRNRIQMKWLLQNYKKKMSEDYTLNKA